MRSRSGLATVLVSALAAGCLTPPTATKGVMDRLRAVAGPQGPDVLVMDVAVIEQPTGDPYIDRDLWSAADEQAVSLDRKAALDDNGFRVAVVGGIVPGRLIAMLTSERSCPDAPHRVTMRSGNPKLLTVAPPLAEVSYGVRTGGDAKPVKLTNAQPALSVVPQRTADGRIKLTVTPQVAHGGRSLFVQPAEGDNWSIAGSRPTEKYPDLSFEVTISPQEYLLVGTRHERPLTLGHTTFAGASGEKPVQRLLVIRGRPQGEPPVDFDWTASGRPAGTAPLAYQAARTARGARE